MEQLCRHWGICRQAYYQKRRRQQQRREEAERVLSLVRLVRQRHPRLGGRKLLVKIRPMLAQEGLHIGRDRLFALLRAEDLLVGPHRQARRRTTWPGSRRAPNRVAGRTFATPDAVWVADITYLDVVGNRFLYLFVLMDMVSRYVVGWCLAPSLAAEYALEALEQAIGHCPRPLAHTIHHSDHGSQYSSQRYWACLQAHGLLASMGEVGNAYENAYAERLVGILKLEYALADVFRDAAEARRAVAQAIQLYNTDRPHTALNYATPWAVYHGFASPVPVTVAASPS